MMMRSLRFHVPSRLSPLPTRRALATEGEREDHFNCIFMSSVYEYQGSWGGAHSILISVHLACRARTVRRRAHPQSQSGASKSTATS